MHGILLANTIIEDAEFHRTTKKHFIALNSRRIMLLLIGNWGECIRMGLAVPVRR